MKKALPLIIAIIIAGIVGFVVGMKLEPKEENEKEQDNKFTIYNEHYLDYDYNLEVDEDDDYVVLDIINNRDDYEDFLEEYEDYFVGVVKDKDYRKKYQYIMVGMELDSCSEEISPKKYKIKNDTLILYLNVKTECGLCALDSMIYEFAVPADLEFEDVEIKFDYIDSGEECPHDVAYKPVLYLYPEKEQLVNVKFAHPENLTTTYPKYNDGWTVTAKPNGDLLDLNNKYYYALYWEEENAKKVDFSEGFYVTKDNAINFLEEKLTILGLNEREKNEFIMYWLPILERNEQNLVYFELTDSLQEGNALEITPAPDSLLRIRIHVKKVSERVDIKEQTLETFARKGFTAIEWGGVIY